MKSRYDYMSRSDLKDSVIQDYYPDPISLDYNNMRLSEKAKTLEMTYTSTLAPWSITEDSYKSPDLEDMLLSLNKIPHRNLLHVEDTLEVPKLDDINASFRK